MPSSWPVAPISITWKSGCRSVSGEHLVRNTCAVRARFAAPRGADRAGQRCAASARRAERLGRGCRRPDRRRASIVRRAWPASAPGWLAAQPRVRAVFHRGGGAPGAAAIGGAGFFCRLPATGHHAGGRAGLGGAGVTEGEFAAVEIAGQFWIVPSWHALPAQAVHSLRLDPGLAFGTGTHPSPRMCLRWIAGRGAPEGQPLGRVLDYGCGSGILALAAAKFGARDVDAVDIDPAAVQATARNAQANAVQLHAGLPEQARGEYQTVLANILATPLRVLAPLLCGHLAPGGRLVLAGILERQAQALKQAYAPWLALTVTDAEDGWILMTARRH